MFYHLLKEVFWHIFTAPMHIMKYVLEPQETYEETVGTDPYALYGVPDRFKTQDMRNEVVRKVPWLMRYVPVHLRTHEMCEIVVQGAGPYMLRFVPDHFKA